MCLGKSKRAIRSCPGGFEAYPLTDLSWMEISKVITKRSEEPTFEWKGSCRSWPLHS